MDGLLDELHEIQAHRHMSECPPSRRFHEALQWGVTELRRQPVVVPSADFTARLERRLQAEAAPMTVMVRRQASATAVLMALTIAASGMFAWNLRTSLAPAVTGFVATPGPLPVIGTGAFKPKARNVISVQAASQESYRYDVSPVDSFGYHGSTYSGQLTASWTGR